MEDSTLSVPTVNNTADEKTRPENEVVTLAEIGAATATQVNAICWAFDRIDGLAGRARTSAR